MNKHEPCRGTAVAPRSFVALAGAARQSDEAHIDGPAAFLLFDRAGATCREGEQYDWFDAGSALIVTQGEVDIPADAEPDG